MNKQERIEARNQLIDCSQLHYRSFRRDIVQLYKLRIAQLLCDAENIMDNNCSLGYDETYEKQAEEMMECICKLETMVRVLSSANNIPF